MFNPNLLYAGLVGAGMTSILATLIWWRMQKGKITVQPNEKYDFGGANHLWTSDDIQWLLEHQEEKK